MVVAVADFTKSTDVTTAAQEIDRQGRWAVKPQCVEKPGQAERIATWLLQ